MTRTTFSMQSLKNSLVTLLGFDVEIWQIAVVGLLLVAFVVCIVIAAIKSGKKRKARIRTYIENEEKAILLRKQLRNVDREIAAINFEYRHDKAAADAAIVKINSDYRSEYGRIDSEYYISCDKLLKLNEKLRDISLRLKKKGIKQYESESLKREFGKIEAEHEDLSEDVAAMREAKNERDKDLKEKLDRAEAERTLKKNDYTAKLSEKERERKSITDELDKLAATQVKISVKDAEAILQEFKASDEAEKELRLKQAQDDVEKAKNEYLGAQELRTRYERERADAVASAKEDAKRKRTLEIAQTETEAKVGYSSPNATLASKEETEDVTEAINTAEARKTIEEYQNAANAAPADDTAATEAVAEETAATEVTAEEENTEAIGEKADTAETEAINEQENTTEPIDEEALAALENLENTMEGVDKNVQDEVISEVEEEATVAENLESDSDTETIADKEIVDEAEEPLTESSIDEFENEIAEIGVTGVEDEIDEEISEAEGVMPEAVECAGETAEETNETAEIDEIAASEEPAAATDIAEEVTATDAEPEEAAPETIETVDTVETEPETAGEIEAIDPEVEEEKIIRMPKVYYNDGIPATPIHKKSKYSKPVTRLLVKKPAVNENTEAAAPQKEEPRKSAYLGKWKVEKTDDGKIYAKLRASNGGILLTTPVYTSEIGLKNGIASIKKYLAADNVNITANKNGKFVFRISTPSGRTIVTSDQYGAKFQCEKALDSAKRFAETAVISE